jgi:predicted amidophosphoribosyltransferase
MTLVTVFLILMSINVYLARKKVGLDKYSTIGGPYKNQRTFGTDSDLITCSECGAQVTDDADFCPHCGEYFEGEEVFCPGCSARINEKDTSCPKCGRIFEENKDEKNREQVDGKTSKKQKDSKSTLKIEKLLCSECGAVVDSSDTKCPGCGFEFKESLKHKKGKVARKITGAEEKAKLQKTLEALEGSEYIEGDYKDDYMCSICGAGVSGKAKVCPKCGTELE